MSDMPELRDGPPWAMEEMILAEPGLVAPILASPAAVEAAESIRESGTGRASSAAARASTRRWPARRCSAPAPRDAFEASLDPQAERRADRDLARGRHRRDAGGDGGATNGARTILITAKPEVDDRRRPRRRHAARGHLVVPHGRLRLAAAGADRDRGRRRRVDVHARDRRARSPCATRFADAARDARRLRAPDRHRQRRRRDHRARARAEDRGGRCTSRSRRSGSRRSCTATCPPPTTRTGIVVIRIDPRRASAARQARRRRARRRRPSSACPR